MARRQTIENIVDVIEYNMAGELPNIFDAHRGNTKPDMILDDGTNQTLLHKVCECNSTLVVKEIFEAFEKEYGYLLKREDKLEYFNKLDAWVNKEDSNNNTAIKLAFQKDNLEIIEMLDHHKAIFDRNDANLFHDLIKYDCLKTLIYQRGRINYEQRNQRGQTLLSYAIKSDNRDHFAFYLIANGAKVNVIDYDGNTPQHLCIEEGNARIIRKIMRNPKIKTDIKNQNGLTAQEFGYKLDKDGYGRYNSQKELKQPSLQGGCFSLQGSFEINKSRSRVVTFVIVQFLFAGLFGAFGQPNYIRNYIEQLITWGTLQVFTILFIQLTSCTKAGYVRKNDSEKSITDDLRTCNIENFCFECLASKPFRSHHCDICKRCVYFYDHHCSFVNNCIGCFNHKYYIIFLFLLNIQIVLTITMSILILSGFVVDKDFLWIYDSKGYLNLTIYALVSLKILIILSLIVFVQLLPLQIKQSMVLSKGITSTEHNIIKNTQPEIKKVAQANGLSETLIGREDVSENDNLAVKISTSTNRKKSCCSNWHDMLCKNKKDVKSNSGKYC